MNFWSEKSRADFKRLQGALPNMKSNSKNRSLEVHTVVEDDHIHDRPEILLLLEVLEEVDLRREVLTLQAFLLNDVISEHSSLSRLG